MNTKISPLIAATLLASGCATYRPITDMAGVDPARHEADLAQCQQYATQVDPGASAVASAAAGAILGGVLAAILGDHIGMSAAASGLISGTVGAAAGGETQKNIIRRCMSGRGYRVLQ